jgi:hypothetical protein
MKARTIVLALVTCFVGLTLCFADDANMGTWKLNEAKSKLSPTAPKNTTVVYDAAGGNVKALWRVSPLTVSQRIASGRASSTGKTIR